MGKATPHGVLRCRRQILYITHRFRLAERASDHRGPQPSAVARNDVGVGAPRSAAIAQSRWCSARVGLTTIPALMPRT